MPKISVIIPVYNVEKYLRRCLDSVRNQTFSDWEAICVNDGSKDNSDKILSEYAKKDKRFKILTKENGGPSDARNFGMKVAKGDYVLFLDSDDFIHPQTLEITYYLAKKENVDVVCFRYDRWFYDKLKSRRRHRDGVYNKLPKNWYRKYKLNRIKCCLTDDILFHSTEKNHTFHVLYPSRRHCYSVLALYNRKLIEDIPFVKGIIIEDFPWWSEVMLKRPKSLMIKIPLYFYIPNKTSILSSLQNLLMIRSIAVGLFYVYNLYIKRTTREEFKHFNREFLWPFTITLMREVKELDNESDKSVVAKMLVNLRKKGVFDYPPNRRSKKYLRRIDNFIRES